MIYDLIKNITKERQKPTFLLAGKIKTILEIIEIIIGIITMFNRNINDCLEYNLICFLFRNHHKFLVVLGAMAKK